MACDHSQNGRPKTEGPDMLQLGPGSHDYVGRADDVALCLMA